MIQPDLLALLVSECGNCPNLGDAIESGIRYCHGRLTWQWSTDRVDGCRYRDRKIPRFSPAGIWADAARDLLEHPRHQITAKDRAWLQQVVREEP